MDVSTAVLLAAGSGMRCLPVSNAHPTQLMPGLDTSTIKFVVVDAVEAGLDDNRSSTGRGTPAIDRPFETAAELDADLQGTRYDIGPSPGWLQATIEMELLHTDGELTDAVQALSTEFAV